MRADLHLHTVYSEDSASPLDDIIARCEEVGIDCIAVTDHNTIAGALEMERIAPFTVVVGEEVLTAQGELIGYFLKEQIPPHLSAQETVRLIREQGGLVAVPHPFDRLRLSTIDHSIMELLPAIDIVEVFNARVLLPRSNARARELAWAHGLLASAGSDAHTIAEIGNAYVEIPPFEGPGEFRLALAQGQIWGVPSGIGVHLRSRWAWARKRMGR